MSSLSTRYCKIMSTCVAATFFLFLALATATSCTQELVAVQAARAALLQAKNWAQASIAPTRLNQELKYHHGEALSECDRLYEESEYRLSRLLAGENYTVDDARIWLSSALACHRTCLDGLEEKGFAQTHAASQNLTLLLGEALKLYARAGRGRRGITFSCF